MQQPLQLLTTIDRIGTGLLVGGIAAMVAVSILEWRRRRNAPQHDDSIAPRRREYR